MIAPTVALVSMPEKMKYITAEELLRMPRSERYELVKGALVEMSPPPGTEHGSLAFQLSYLIGHFVKQHELGRVFAAETGFRLARNPDTVRAADVAFVAKSRLPAKLPKGYLDLAPGPAGFEAHSHRVSDQLVIIYQDYLHDTPPPGAAP